MIVIGHLEYLGALDRLLALLDSSAGASTPSTEQQRAQSQEGSERAGELSAESGGAASVLWRVCLVSGGLSAAVTNDTACLVRLRG